MQLWGLVVEGNEDIIIVEKIKKNDKKREEIQNLKNTENNYLLNFLLNKLIFIYLFLIYKYYTFGLLKRRQVGVISVTK
jgi:hypothetical protein